ncbi:MAG TPA: thioesterase family protein [Polyangiales bacterium]|nr:thioesterase family protein [Polyangiales bacterium]
MRIPAGVESSSLRVRVGYIDTDQAKVMHHGSYVRYLEMARVELLRERGVDYKSFELDRRLALPVVEVNIRYKLPARFDDALEIKTWVGLVNRAKLRFDSVILRGSELLTVGQITLCCISVDEQRICSMPDVLLALG